MRQVFFLLVSAMIAAFSLSWASPGLGDHDYLIPDEVILPLSFSLQDKLEISSLVSLKDSCERIEEVGQEVRGSKIILSIKVLHVSDSVCVQQIRTDIAVNFLLENLTHTSKQVDVYFREDEENLKYFGSVELK